MRQKPILYSPPNQDGPYYRRWRAWGICTADGLMAEITMDPDKAAVWKRGGHKVVDFTTDEAIGDKPPELPTDGVQGVLS
jgi:hypothetical protein